MLEHAVTDDVGCPQSGACRARNTGSDVPSSNQRLSMSADPGCPFVLLQVLLLIVLIFLLIA